MKHQLLLAVAIVACTAGCALFRGKEPPRSWEIVLQSADSTAIVPKQEWLMIEGALLDSPEFQRFIDTAQPGSNWTVPAGNRTYRWQIDAYDPLNHKVVVKRFIDQ